MKTAARIIVTLIVKYGIIVLCLGLVLNWNFNESNIRSVLLPVKGDNAASPSQTTGSSSVSSAQLNSEWGETGMAGLKQYEYGKTLLTLPEKEVYEEIVNAIHNVEPQVTIKSSITVDELSTVYEYVYYDHSELFYLDYPKFSVSTGLISQKYTVKFNYLYGGDRDTIIQMRQKVNDVATKMLSHIKGQSGEDKEKELHDAIINTCDYNTPAMDNPDGNPDSFNIYGVFVDKKAVCNGYAQALKLLLNSEGIKALYVTGIGYTEDGHAPHAWNMACIDDNWRYLDATFDDPVYSYGGQDYDYHTISYDYFNYVSNDDHVLGAFNPHTTGNKISENYAKMPDVE